MPAGSISACSSAALRTSPLTVTRCWKPTTIHSSITRRPGGYPSDPIFGGLCQDNLETGDVVEVLSGNPVYPVPMHNRTYHPSNEALFSGSRLSRPQPHA